MLRSEPTSSTGFTPAPPGERTTWDEINPPAPEPKSELANYRLLSPNAAVRVSPLCLGGTIFGDQWTGWLGSAMGFEESCKLLDTYHEAGGNFIDLASNYQDGQSEMIVGEWMEKRGIRDEIVIATKYSTFSLNNKENSFSGVPINYAGNSRKNLRLTVEASLKKLRTDYIDLLYVHWWDYSASIPEVMLSLNDLVKSGKVLYLGISDTPAWIVAQANEFARQNALTPFAIYQGNWNVGKRDMERDIIPMCRANGMSVAAWGVLGQGKFKSPDELKDQAYWRDGVPPTEAELAVSHVLQEVADELGEGIRPANVAMAWARHVVADIFPIVGISKPEYLQSNIEALKIVLTGTQIQKLNNATPFAWGFPFDLFGRDPHYLPGGKPESYGMKSAGHVKFTKMP
ncbi:hypothetical protein L202_00142 [Cryptococcus amylolentus CBS 6039]|uniref:NADP-dependent oxidoreductase domain-containing protein n=1 Tax=Cryptococcus amylolentus CBS 6039 TaxID=1295533 RepID=A0A1E3I613_9TREE|nr:hypothetical protein L202_00142 [Cryptococcus amylolentus CBS 6039]ODN84133.1 hypothetical protein L202_00142 [Cryptococcus amylolentus CBS 6039]